MDQQDRLADFEKRAENINWKVADICKAGGIANSTYSRWRSGTGALEKTLDRIDEALTREETRLLEYLKHLTE